MFRLELSAYPTDVGVVMNTCMFLRNRNNLCYIRQKRLRLPCLSFSTIQLMSPAILAHVVTVKL